MKNLKKGFTLLEVCIALLFGTLFMMLMYECIEYLNHNSINYHHVQDDLNAYQLKDLLMLSKDIKVKDYEISFMYQNSKCYLEIDLDRVVLTPGYVIYYSLIENAIFIESDQSIELRYKRDDIDYKKVIYEK